MTTLRLVLAWALCGVLSSGTQAASLAIDLADPNPLDLERLPGIMPDEVGELREVAGLGADDLGTRLAATSIDPERLRRWGPYLELRGGALRQPRSRVRLQRERNERGDPATDLSVRVDAQRVRWEARLRERDRETEAASHLRREIRLLAKPASGIEVAVGSLRGGLSGGDPWSDPLSGSRISPTLTTRMLLRTASTARGAFLRAGPFSGARWREPEGIGSLVRLGSSARAVWWGRSARGDGGVGLLWTNTTTTLVLRASDDRKGTRRVRAGIVDPRGETWFFAGGVLGRTRSGREARVDLGKRGGMHGWRIAAALGFEVVAQTHRTRGRLHLTRGRFPRALGLDLRWHDRTRDASAAFSRSLGPTWVEITLQGSERTGRREGSLCGSVGMRGQRRAGELEVSIATRERLVGLRLEHRFEAIRLWLVTSGSAARIAVEIARGG